ncbi:BgTH12-07132 [Blumeria graminis f. sp. triticale]|uniref:BgTH12-07132 n=1 Tax=Blumeria graminis f. sp. triticale TaxID=1689686 RepID=A0A9W4DE98_BLUGR|nr:BgTH12-07132 [Blumeria graminis f. sp. triticale]
MDEIDQAQGPTQSEQPTMQTIIDLTEDIEDLAPSISTIRSRSRPNIPSIFNRSEAVSRADIVDLTGDIEHEEEEDEIIFTGQRRVAVRPGATRFAARAQPNNTRRPRRSSSPSLFLPAGPISSTGYRSFSSSHGDNGLAFGLARLGQMFSPHIMEHIPAFVHLGAIRPMAGRVDHGRGSTMERRPEHIPPPAARDNFTRSPTQSDTIICPNCEKELIHNKESIVRKTGKAPSKKDREEHPFWVVKECGHVYCNNCFQSRLDKTRKSAFTEEVKPTNTKSSTRKVLICAVDDCKCDVRGKDKWVGVFM